MEEKANQQVQSQANDFWQAEVLGQIYETSFAEMAQWIAEGALMPTDKVRRGNLRWLEAGKVPTLLPFFNARENGTEPPFVPVTVTDANLTGIEDAPATENFENFHAPPVFEQPDRHQTDEPGPDHLYRPSADVAEVPAGDFCLMHPDAAAKFSCETCGSAFCPQCPKSYGGTVKICPMCGAMCKKIGEVDVKKEKEMSYSRDLTEGFGAKDIGRAFSHPFNYKSSFVFGGVMFMIFTLGQSASAIGGIMMLFASLVCFLLANMLSFGILANTVENFSQGKLNANFMPGFDDFNLWDDVVHPFFLWLGTIISSFGPFILIVVIGMYMIISSVTDRMKNMQNGTSQIESPFTIDEQKALDQSGQVKKLLEDVDARAAERKDIAENGLGGDEFSMQNGEDKEIEEINRMIGEGKKRELEAIVGKTQESKDQEFQQMLSGLLNLGLPIVILSFAAFLWGVFYFPAACAVAGYTRSFWATVNPSTGIDTIRTFGADYLKILGVFVLLSVMTGIVSFLMHILFLPFLLPGMGNLPAIAATSWFTFYFSIVFSCVLGYALYKNSDKFKFYRG